jgi:hypothetical protein
MNLSDYALEMVVENRLAELREEAERWGRFEVGEPELPRLRSLLGRALARLGSRMARASEDWFRRARA